MDEIIEAFLDFMISNSVLRAAVASVSATLSIVSMETPGREQLESR